MRATTAALLAAISLSLGFGGQVFSAQPNSSSATPSLSSPGSDDSLDAPGDSMRLRRYDLAPQEVPVSYNGAEGSEIDSLVSDSSDVDVARELATRLNYQDEQANADAPVPDGAIAEGSGSPLCCPPACCPPACCCPCWSIYAGTIFLNQSRPGHSPILNPTATPDRVTPLGPPALSANQFNPGTRFGFEIDAIRHNVCGSCWDLEARYFGINRWDSTVPTITTPAPGLAIPFVPTPIKIANTGNAVATVYESLLQNVEFNGRRRVNSRLQLIAGLRYLAFDDKIGITVTPPIGAARYSMINTRNNLIGPQIGANAFLWQGNRLGLQAFGKGGIYGNAASNNVSVTSTTGTVFASTANVGHTSFVGEIGLTGTYRLTNNWGIRTTYEMLWLDGVALAPDQIATSNPVTGAGSVAANSSLFYYGGFVGLEYYR